MDQSKNKTVIKDGGEWIKVKTKLIKDGGDWIKVKTKLIKDGGDWNSKNLSLKMGMNGPV